jgi:cobalt/nickel transport system ATP-binding protein
MIMQNIIETKNLSFSYSGKANALSDVTLSIPAGKKTVFLGPNGSGKSTLFLHFNGVHKPDSGEVHFAGNKIRYDSQSLAKLRSQVAVVFQNPDDQIFSSTVEEDVAFGPLNLGLERGEVEARVEEALSWVGISSLRSRPTQQLSFGQRKRVAIAGALAMKPSVLIMDEPTAGLDAQMVHELLELSDELNAAGLTVIMSTHDVETAYEWADSVRALHVGKCVFSGKPEEFFSQEELLHKLGLVPPLPLLLNKQMHWRRGVSERPYPKSIVELSHKLFSDGKAKQGTIRIVCLDVEVETNMEHKASAKKPASALMPASAAPDADLGTSAITSSSPRLSKSHLLSGVYGAYARRMAEEGRIDVHYRFHALEHALLQASLGNDFVLYADSSTCALVEERAIALEKKIGLKIRILHGHDSSTRA